MTILELLSSKGFIEGKDFTYDGEVLVVLEQSRIVDKTINHEAVEAVPEFWSKENEENKFEQPKLEDGITIDETWAHNPAIPGVAAYDETIQVEEKFFASVPSLDELKSELILNISDAVVEFLSSKEHLKTSDDSLNFVDNKIFCWNLKNIPQPTVSELYDSYLIAVQKETELKRKQLILETGRKAREACDNALDIISGYNQNRELTPEQITEMATTFTPILNALSILKRPGVAKALIQAATVDGVIVTEAMKADLLDALKDF